MGLSFCVRCDNVILTAIFLKMAILLNGQLMWKLVLKANYNYLACLILVSTAGDGLFSNHIRKYVRY